MRVFAQISIFILTFILIAACNGSPASITAEEGFEIGESELITGVLEETCPTTARPEDPFVPPEPYPAVPPEAYANEFWHGTSELWTMLREDGTWFYSSRNDSPYPQKIFWWREGYDPRSEPQPDLTISATRLDAPGDSFSASGATNATADFGHAMLIGVDIPSAGCWEITGHYRGHQLSFVVLVGP